jgi:hypothetical protein
MHSFSKQRKTNIFHIILFNRGEITYTYGGESPVASTRKQSWDVGCNGSGKERQKPCLQGYIYLYIMLT